MRYGFSLVELSIVLVILGLLTGGILAGQSLIRAAELRSVSTEYARYTTSINTFRDKYFALPGDMSNATKFWGDDNAACPDAAVVDGTPGTCNGNGNGIMNQAAAINATGEIFQFWKQLALAGIIEGSYSGLAGPGTTFPGLHGVIGTNIPASKLSSAGWGIMNLSNHAGDATSPAYDYGNNYVFGRASSIYLPSVAALTAPEAWNIDTKVDDGLPVSGRFIALYWGACTTGTLATDRAALYRLDASGAVCSFRVAKAEG